MKHISRLFLSLLLLIASTQAAKADWYGDKYSMFIHYGLYSIPGGVFDGQPVRRGYSEQILTFGIGFSDWYEAYAREFTAEHFDATEIVRLAETAGMRSIVLTSKHHDGFCLWNTATTDYNTYAGTPAHRDLVGELAEKCHATGMRFGLYFSLIDWHLPAAMPFSSHNADRITPDHHRYNMSQIRELLTKYGKVDELWFDMGSMTPEQSKEMYALVKSLQPDCMVSGRLGNDQADFCVMPDNQYPDYLMDMPWQSAASMFDETWGYRSWQERGSAEDKAIEKLTSLINVVSSGGKYLLNIGPMGDGSVVPFEAEVLKRIGEYIEPMKEAIYGTLPAPFPMTAGRPRMTMSADGRDLYVFVPKGQPSVVVPATLRPATSVQMLNGKTLSSKRQSDGSLLVSGITGSLPFNVVHLRYHSVEADLSGWQSRVQPYFAQSSGDYYSTFKSVVGYRHVLPAEVLTVRLSFGDSDKGRTILLNDRSVVLESVNTNTIRVNGVTPIGRLEEAPARGLMGSLRPLTDYKWTTVNERWSESIARVVGTKGGVLFRQKLQSDVAIDYPLNIEYTEGMMLFLNGEYIDATPSVAEGGKISVLLPLRPGENELMIKLYARWGQECRMKVTPQSAYTQYIMDVPQELLRSRADKLKVLDIKRPHIAPLASPAHLSSIRVLVE